MRREAGAQTPDVSVIIPVFNSEQWLHECINSALRQTGVGLQIICVNDGSEDQSAAILAEYELLCPNIEVITQANAGLSAARNAGLAKITGRYVVFLDSDDYWREDDLAKLVACADRNELDLLVFDALPFPALGVARETWQRYRTYYRQRGTYEEPRTGVRLAADMQENKDYRPAAWKYLFAAELVQRHRLRFLPRVIHEDNAFTFGLFLRAQRAAHMALPFYARRVRPESIMTTVSAQRSGASLERVWTQMGRELVTVSHTVTPSELAQLRQIIQKVHDYAAKLFANAVASAPDPIGM
ncbi:MAG: glycosyltransferase [Cellulomonadaceae bacterium]|nr:glycosyltransferase [Cellulomonadaceae bacterium]